MIEVFSLVKRNTLVYCKDKSNLFFTFLAMFIVIALQLLFLGRMNVESAEDMMEGIPGVTQAVIHSNCVNLVYSWVVAGIVAINAFMVSNNVLAIMVTDEDKKMLPSFYVAPIKRSKLMLGYCLTAIIMGILFSIGTVIISEVIIVMSGGTILSTLAFAKVLGIIVIHVFTTTALVFFISLFVHTASAFSGLTTVIGTLLGFISALYLPMGLLPQGIQNVLKVFPILHASSLLREVFTYDAVVKTFANAPTEVVAEYKEYMGMTLKCGEASINDIYKVLIIVGSGIIFLLLSILVMKNRRVSDR